mmetsp:Transcript_27619/g.48801  ORF Transcript_27619/g.48801 Transcript_27619/m.48801 type:complete len:207 (+) Transcript_27619:278-898(+)
MSAVGTSSSERLRWYAVAVLFKYWTNDSTFNMRPGRLSFFFENHLSASCAFLTEQTKSYDRANGFESIAGVDPRSRKLLVLAVSMTSSIHASSLSCRIGNIFATIIKNGLNEPRMLGCTVKYALLLLLFFSVFFFFVLASFDFFGFGSTSISSAVSVFSSTSVSDSTKFTIRMMSLRLAISSRKPFSLSFAIFAWQSRRLDAMHRS